MPTDFDSDAMLSFLSELTKKFADLKKEMVSVGDQSGIGLHKASDETDRFGKTVDLHTKHIEGMKNETAGLVGLLRGPLGIASAFYGASQAMGNFVRGELQLRNFASDVGISASAIQRMRVQLSAAGIDAKTADQQISALTSKLDSIKTLTTASPVYKDIAANDPILAKQLLDAERVGNRLRSIQLIQEKLNEPGAPRSKLYLQDKLGINASTAQALGKDTKGLVMPWVYDEKELEKYNRDWTNLTTSMTNVWNYTLMGMVGQTNEFIENTKREINALREFFKKDMTGPKGFLPNKKELEDAWEALKKQMSSEAHASTPTGKEALLEGDASFGDRFGQWGEGDEGALPKNARPRSFSPESLQKDELELQKDSNKTLQDIRDLLSGDKEGIWGGGGGRGGGGSSGAGTPGTPGRRGTGADGRVPETTDDPAYGGKGSDEGGIGGRDYLYGQRKRFKEELDKDPQLRLRAAAILSLENEGAKTGVMESLWNRLNIPGHERSASSGLAGGPNSFYGPGRHPGMVEERMRLLQRDPKHLEKLYGLIEESYYSNLIEGYTDQGSKGDPNYEQGGVGKNINRERFNDWGEYGHAAARAARRAQQEAYKRAEDRARAVFAARGATADEAQRAELGRNAMDKSLVRSGDLGGAKIKVDFSGSQGSTADPKILDEGPFKKLKIARSPQAPMAGGGVTDYNRFSFE
jgi:hypothetical protein